MLRGRVVDGGTGAGLAGAEVSAAGRRAVTDSAGGWWLQAVPGTLRVRRLGYAPRDVTARAGEEIRVQLDPLAIMLDAVIVTAARREQKLADAIPEVRLLTRQDVERSGGGDVSAVLAQVTGNQPEGGVPAGSGVLLQGLGSQRVLVLLDGQPLVGRINGNFDLSRLPSSMVDRIEIVRGPQSTLYGSDAMGGVVNILTRAPAQRMAGSLSVVGGTQARRELSGNASATRGRLGFSLDAGTRSEALAPGLEGDDGTQARRWNVAPRLQWKGGEGVSVEAAGLVIGERQRYRTGQLFHFGDNIQLAARLGMAWQRGARRLAPTISWTRFDHLSRASTSGQPASDSGQRDVQDVLQAEVTYNGPLPGGLLDAGLVLRHDAIRADRVRGVTRALDGVEGYAQGSWSVGALSLSPGVRVSRHAQWGNAVTPRVAALLRPSPAIAMRASVGAGYRAPDFKELYLDFVNAAAGYAVAGNPGLRPEHSLNATLGVEAVGSRFYGITSVYTNRLRDFIDFGAPDAGGTYTYQNIGRGVTRGLDVEAGWTPRRARVEMGYAWLDAFDAATSAPLLGRSRHSAHLTGSLPLRGAAVSGTLRYTGRAPSRRNDATGAITAWRDAFTRADLRVQVPVSSSLRLSGGVDNLFDARPAGTWPGFTGRRMYAGATWGR